MRVFVSLGILICIMGTALSQDRDIADLIKDLSSPDKNARSYALLAMGRKIKNEPSMIHYFIQAFSDPDYEVRSTAEEEISSYRLDNTIVTTKVIPLLTEAALDFRDMVRYHAIEALGKLEARFDAVPSNVVPVLEISLSHANSEIRASAAATLGNMREKATSAIPTLVKLLKDTDISVKFATMFALSKMGKKAGVALPPLIDALSDPDENIRMWAASACGAISGDEYVIAVPALIKTLADSNNYVRRVAVDSLGEIARRNPSVTKEIIQALHTTLLNDQYASVRIRAIYNLGSLGPNAAVALKEIAQLCKDLDKKTSKAALWAYSQISSSQDKEKK